MALKRLISCSQFESFEGDERTFEQFKSLKMVNGTRIDHPKRGKVTDKDRSDCWAAIAYYLTKDLLEEGVHLNNSDLGYKSKLVKEGGLVPTGPRIDSGFFGGPRVGGRSDFLR